MNKINFSSASTFKLGVLSLALFAASGAYAATTTATANSTGSINPSSVVDTSANNTPTTGGVNTSGGFSVSKYNGGGVLTGASFAAVVGAQTIEFSGTNGSGTVSGNASATGTLTLGLVAGSATSLSTATVTGVSGSTRTGTIASYTVSAAATTQAQLNSFYGTGNVAGSISEVLNANLTSRSNNGTRNLDVNNANNPAAALTATYTSVNHANGSFGSSAVDTNVISYSFGDIANGATPSAYAFSIYNLAGSYGLQVVGAVYTGDDLFTLTGITGIPNLAAGASTAGSVNFGPTTVAGAHSGYWTITVADSASGIGAGKNLTGTDTLRLNVSANVLAPVTPVPEPETYAMMLAGLMMMGTIARRRNKNRA